MRAAWASECHVGCSFLSRLNAPKAGNAAVRPHIFLSYNYAIKYADMPNQKSAIDPAMLRLPLALQERMRALDHTQGDVSIATGVSQPQISKALNGRRKRLTTSMRILCRYAGLEVAHQEHPPALVELTQLLQTLVDGNPGAAECVKGVLKSLAPLVARAHLRQSH